MFCSSGYKQKVFAETETHVLQCDTISRSRLLGSEIKQRLLRLWYFQHLKTKKDWNRKRKTYFLHLEMFYLNTIEQLFLSVEQLVHLEVCLPYSRLLTGIQILAVFQNLRWNSNKTSLHHVYNAKSFTQSIKFAWLLIVSPSPKNLTIF